MDFIRMHLLYLYMDTNTDISTHVLTCSTLLCVSLSIGIVRTRSPSAPARLSLLPHQAPRADSGALIIVTTSRGNAAGSAVAGLSMRPVVAKTEAPPNPLPLCWLSMQRRVRAARRCFVSTAGAARWSVSGMLKMRAADGCYPHGGRIPSVQCNVTNTLRFPQAAGWFSLCDIFIYIQRGGKTADRKHLKINK